MSEIDTRQMSRETLEQTAADLGITFRASISDERLAERIRAQLGETTPAANGPVSKPRGAKRCELIIATDAADRQPVYVAVNGHNYIIRRGEKALVPAEVVEVLQNAVQYQYDPESMTRQEVLAYPFQVTRWIED